ncbi:MAG TPA: cytochrome ubiquinol oxidase subunit I [Pseudonocardia sp.]
MSPWDLALVDPDHVVAARQLQTLSFVMHIPLVCSGIAFPALVLYAEWRWLRTGDELYRTLARRWSRVLVALFAAGVVTGTILSFEMGLLWPVFTGTFGGVFGLGFAVDGFSFFTEAIFIGIYVYGWNRLPPRAHLAAGIPVVVAGLTGSMMVIAVNAWMQHPGGFTLRDGRVVDADPVPALFANPYLWHELVHMYLAGYVVTGFLGAAVYAVGRTRGRWGDYERTALRIPLTVAAVAAVGQMVAGDWAARTVARLQPAKLAAMEGLGRTGPGAPLHLLGWYRDGDVRDGIAIPRLLSLLAFHDPDAVVLGLDAVPVDAQPPVNLVRLAFQLMVFIGLLLAVFGALHLVQLRRHLLPESRWFYRALVLAAPLSVVALLAGWVVTEVGRQPWVVFGVMRTEQAVTRVGVAPVGLGTLAVVYLGVTVGVVWVLRRLAAMPLAEPSTVPAPTMTGQR